jgi:hypothetical protein
MLNFIGIGKENSIKRSELCALSGLSDRNMRREIENLQMQGYRIVNMSDSIGYYVAKNDAEFNAYMRQERSRIFKELKKLYKMEEGL